LPFFFLPLLAIFLSLPHPRATLTGFISPRQCAQ
jgi:hypothetical protein